VVEVRDPFGDDMMPEVEEVSMRSTGSDDEVEILGPACAPPQKSSIKPFKAASDQKSVGSLNSSRQDSPPATKRVKLDGNAQVKQFSTPKQEPELFVINRKKDMTLLTQGLPGGVIGKRGRSERPEIVFKRLASDLPKGQGREQMILFNGRIDLRGLTYFTPEIDSKEEARVKAKGKEVPGRARTNSTTSEGELSTRLNQVGGMVPGGAPTHCLTPE
jgi:hypothetical protein